MMKPVHAGNYPVKSSASYITNSNYWYWLMSSAGASNTDASAWSVGNAGNFGNFSVSSSVVRPVISLKAGLLWYK